jgi:hypothetical protein
MTDDWTPDSADFPPPGTSYELCGQWIDKQRGVKGGVDCPACEHHYQERHRPIPQPELQVVKWLYDHDQEHPGEFVNVPNLIARKGRKDNREIAKLLRWGLVEEEARLREDGGRAGFYRISKKGRDFVEGRIAVESHSWDYRGDYVLDNRRMVYIDEAVKDPELRHDLRKLRRWVPHPPPDDDPSPASATPMPPPPAPKPTGGLSFDPDELRARLKRNRERSGND